MTPDTIIIGLSLLIGVFAGLSAGLLGIGGGIVIVPALSLIFALRDFDSNIIMQMAIGTSLSTIIFTSLSSAYAHHKNNSINWPVLTLLSQGVLLGVISGSLFATELNGVILSKIFGFSIIIIAISMVSRVNLSKKLLTNTSGERVMAGGLIGLLSSILGIGGGTLSVPYLKYSGIQMRQAIATSSACGVPIAVAASICYIYLGYTDMRLPESSLGYIHWPSTLLITLTSVTASPFGVRLATKISTPALTRMFALALAITGMYMLI